MKGGTANIKDRNIFTSGVEVHNFVGMLNNVTNGHYQAYWLNY